MAPGVSNSGTLTLNDASSISDNAAYRRAGVLVDAGATLTLNDSSSIRDNYGGRLRWRRCRWWWGDGGGGTAHAERLQLDQRQRGPEQRRRGADRTAAGRVILNGSSSIGGNTAPDGGGVFMADGTLTLNDSASISGNEAWEAGGGVYDAGGTLTGVICGSAAGANVYGNTPDDCYAFGEPRRIERADDGVALTFPVGWDIEITNDWRTAETGPGACEVPRRSSSVGVGRTATSSARSWISPAWPRSHQGGRRSTTRSHGRPTGQRPKRRSWTRASPWPFLPARLRPSTSTMTTVGR